MREIKGLRIKTTESAREVYDLAMKLQGMVNKSTFLTGVPGHSQEVHRPETWIVTNLYSVPVVGTPGLLDVKVDLRRVDGPAPTWNHVYDFVYKQYRRLADDAGNSMLYGLVDFDKHNIKVEAPQ